MRITYIFHSGFAIQIPGVTLIVDYFKDSDAPGGNRRVIDTLLQSEGEIYVLSTHVHHDHFNPEILEWRNRRPDIHYIFSKDILKRKAAKTEDAVYLRKGETYQDEHLYVKAYGSTDVGVSFYFSLGGYTLFHAGDLNNWHWKDESTEDEIKKAEGDYLAELRDIRKDISSVDIAMFPVDRRMGSDYMRGAEQFVDTIQTKVFIPMHFTLDYKGGNAFAPYAKSKGVLFIPIIETTETLII